MAHTSLYRTYRPASFDDVVGQNHIERTLRNAVGEGTVAHAYLFTGPRGTGKTTTARILAKALLCEKGPTPDPDATCEQCIEIAEGRHPDVFELDAASRTGVDNVREEIIGRVQFAPTRGRYKVYIIDEVHMLSTAAFNALLKTLEEPPPNVVFVLCTTHPHKVPDTIHSRCQRFDFHRISVEDIVSRLRTICDAEKFEVSDAALSLIARHAAGGMRDAITTLEQLAVFGNGKIGLEDVEGLLGEVDAEDLFEIAGLVARRDVAGAFRWVARFAEGGTDLAEFVREFTRHIRDLYLIAAVGDVDGIVDATLDERSRMTAQAKEFGGPDRLARVLDLLGELGSEMRWSSDARLSLEVALTRMARPGGEMTLAALAERVEGIERGMPATESVSAYVRAEPAPTDPQPAPRKRGSEAPAAKSEAPPAKPEAPPAKPEAPEPAEKPQPAPRAAAGATLDRAAIKRGWQAVLMEIKKRKPARSHTFAVCEVDVDSDGSTIVIEFPPDQGFFMKMAEEPEMRDLVASALNVVFGAVPPFRYQLGRGVVRPAQKTESAPPARELPAQREPEPEAPAAEAPAAESPASPQQVAGVSDDLQELLVNGLGATIVGERTPEAPSDEEPVEEIEEMTEPDPSFDQGLDFGMEPEEES
jgi:DNA polymerase-3 subunit gamma/tau